MLRSKSAGLPISSREAAVKTFRPSEINLITTGNIPELFRVFTPIVGLFGIRMESN